jgi:serine/threonine protein kinase
MIDYCFDEKHECTYIILEYAENGTLFDYIRENGLKDKRLIKGFFLSVCEAIDYMHSKSIMHRDIKVSLCLRSPRTSSSTAKTTSKSVTSGSPPTANHG